MYFLLLFLALLSVIILFVFCEPVAISFFLDTNTMDMHAVVRWIPFIRIEMRVIDYRIFLTVYLFGKKVYATFMKPRKKEKPRNALFNSLALSNTNVKISYGFNEPYLTGIFSLAADFAASLIQTADLELEPEFIPENEFLRIKANTELNAGITIIYMMKSKFTNAKRRNNNGSTGLKQ